MARRSRRKNQFWGFVVVLLITATVAYSFLAYRQPLPGLVAVSTLSSPTAHEPVALPWPSYGEAAVGAKGFGILATHNSDTVLPTASVAKIMTALAVLRVRPIAPGAQGPTLTLTKADVGYYDAYFAKGGSLVKIRAGERITEYQALEAMLLPSANNMAESLAVWAFGSETAYTTYANNYAKQLELAHAHFADASGFSPQTVATAGDLVRLGLAAENNPVLARIVSEKSARLPVAGTVNNVNWLIRYEHFSGLKTGSTDQDGGAVLFSEPITFSNGQTTVIVGAIMGAKFLARAMNDVFPLTHAVAKNFQPVTIIAKGQTVGHYDVPWGAKIDIAATKPMVLMTWRGQRTMPKVSFSQLHAPITKGATAGIITTAINPNLKVSVVTKQAAIEPTWYWRTFRKL